MRWWLVPLVVLMLAGPAEASTIVYRCGYNVCAVNADGTKQRQLTRAGKDLDTAYEHAQLTPDGRTLIYEHERRVWLADRRGRKVRALARPRRRPLASVDPRLDPTGRRVLYDHGFGPYAWQPCIATLAARARPRCGPLEGKGSCRSLAWGTSGLIAVRESVVRRSGLDERCGRRILEADGALDGPPVLSPDGRLYAAEVDERVVVFNARTGRRMHTVGFDEAHAPTWSPDGRSLAFVGVESSLGRYRGGASEAELCIVRRDNRGGRCILTGSALADPHWGG